LGVISTCWGGPYGLGNKLMAIGCRESLGMGRNSLHIGRECVYTFLGNIVMDTGIEKIESYVYRKRWNGFKEDETHKKRIIHTALYAKIVRQWCLVITGHQ